VRGGTRIGCRSINPLLNPTIPFRVRGGIFTLLLFHKPRGLRLLFECGIMNFSYFIEEEGEGQLGVGQSILY